MSRSLRGCCVSEGVRLKYGIVEPQPSLAKDMCIACFCGPCATCQALNEIDLRSTGTVYATSGSAAPTQQAMGGGGYNSAPVAPQSQYYAAPPAAAPGCVLVSYLRTCVLMFVQVCWRVLVSVHVCTCVRVSVLVSTCVWLLTW